MRFQIALTSDSVAKYGGVSFGELGGHVAKRRKKGRRMAVKHKSADKYVGRPNQQNVYVVNF